MGIYVEGQHEEEVLDSERVARFDDVVAQVENMGRDRSAFIVPERQGHGGQIVEVGRGI